MGRRADAQRTARRASVLARQRQESRRRAWLVSAVAVAVLLVAALAGIGVWQAGRSGEVAVPPGATADGTGLAVGDGPVTVEVYLDFLCPACRQFDQAARPVLAGYLADGTVTVVYRPIAILDQQSTTRFSTRAAAAAGCVGGGSAMDGFVTGMMASQPPEGTAGLTDDEIIQIGVEAGAGGGTGPGGESFGRCVRDGTYHDWAERNTELASQRGVRGTPTVFVDGTLLELRTVETLVEAIENAS